MINIELKLLGNNVILRTLIRIATMPHSIKITGNPITLEPMRK